MNAYEWMFIAFLSVMICVMIHYRVDFVIIMAVVVCFSMLAIGIRITIDSDREDMKLKVEELLIVTNEIERKQKNHEQRLRDLEDI